MTNDVTMRSPISPLAAALRAAGMMALFGLLVRFGWGYFDPEMRSWNLVVISPLLGLLAFLHVSKRTKAIAMLLVLLGLGALAFWVVVLLSGAFPVTSRAEWIYVAVILGFPAVCLVVGVRMLAKLPRA